MSVAQEAKKIKIEESEEANSWLNVDSGPGSPHSDNSPDDAIEGNYLDVEGESSITSSKFPNKIKKKTKCIINCFKSTLSTIYMVQQ